MGIRVGRMEGVPGQVEIRAGWVKIEAFGGDARRALVEVRPGDLGRAQRGPTKEAVPTGVRRADVPPVFISA